MQPKITRQCRGSAQQVLLVLGLFGLFASGAWAGQGCPFDNNGCADYCGQQGCQMGYCGHFAWIQCICRRCGDEWNWYDKVRFNPDTKVNQTELDSLKLNGSAPIILTNSSEPADKKPVELLADNNHNNGQAQQRQQQSQQPQQPQQQKAATLTTLLIPDLSDGSKLDLNDIPDENSEKFLDYLAKNHEKLAQATSARSTEQQQANQRSLGDESDDEPADGELNGAGTPINSDDETVEIQISSSNNASQDKQQQQQQQPLPQSQSDSMATPTITRHQSVGQVTRLLRMAADELELDE